MTDGGTLLDQVSRHQVQVPDSPPIVSQGLMFQDWPTGLKGWALVTLQGLCYVCVHMVMTVTQWGHCVMWFYCLAEENILERHMSVCLSVPCHIHVSYHRQYGISGRFPYNSVWTSPHCRTDTILYSKVPVIKTSTLFCFKVPEM
jgi:hypothetical protein